MPEKSFIKTRTSESVHVYNKQNTPRDSRRLRTRPLFLNSALNSPPSQHSLSATISVNQTFATSLKFDLLLQTLPRRFGGEIQSFLDLGELSWMKKLQRSNWKVVLNDSPQPQAPYMSLDPAKACSYDRPQGWWGLNDSRGNLKDYSLDKGQRSILHPQDEKRND